MLRQSRTADVCMLGQLCRCLLAKPLSEDLFRLLSVPARVQDGATAAAVRISGDGKLHPCTDLRISAPTITVWCSLFVKYCLQA
jgi:hypothetical protein